MFNGYSKDLFEEKNESAFLNNVKAVCAIRDKYNFRKETDNICVQIALCLYHITDVRDKMIRAKSNCYNSSNVILVDPFILQHIL